MWSRQHVCESPALTGLPPGVLSFYTSVASEGSPNRIPALLWAMDTPVSGDRTHCVTYQQAARWDPTLTLLSL